MWVFVKDVMIKSNGGKSIARYVHPSVRLSVCLSFYLMTGIFLRSLVCLYTFVTFIHALLSTFNLIQYKPLTQPKKCNKCDRRNIKAAYHTVCNDCSFVLVTVPTKPSQDPTMDDSSTTTSDTNPPNPQTADITKTKRVRMCSVCFKEPIMSKSEEERKEEECKQLEEELTQEVVASSGSDRLSLREKKSIERKIQQHMNTGKGDRVKNEHHDDDNDEEDVSEEDSQLSHDSEGLEEDVANVEIHDQDKSNKDDEDDPFLKAIGGKDKMLVGEAYQKMLLAKNASNTN